MSRALTTLGFRVVPPPSYCLLLVLSYEVYKFYEAILSNLRNSFPKNSVSREHCYFLIDFEKLSILTCLL